MDFSVNGIHQWILFISLIKLALVKGEVIQPVKETRTHVVCLDTEEMLQFSNPFDSSLGTHPDFVMFEWKWQSAAADGKEVSLMYISKRAEGKEKINVEDDRFSKYEFWGLQISDLKYEDSGTFIATYMSLETSLSQTVSVNVVVASPPTLKSDSLQMKVTKVGAEKKVTCGQVASLGNPPVDLVLRAGNGTILDATYEDGSVFLMLDSKADAGEFLCGVADSSPAKECIAAVDLDKWDSTLSFGRATASADTTGIVAGIAAGIVVLLIIIAIVLIVVKKRKRGRKEKTYNTKSEEAKVTGADQPLSLYAHSELDEDDPYNRRSSSVSNPPYLPSKAASPYAVTGLKMDDNDSGRGSNHYASTTPNSRLVQQPNHRAPIYREPPVAAPEGDSDYDAVDASTANSPPFRKTGRGRNPVNNGAGGGGVNAESRKSWAGVVDNFKERAQQQQQQQQQQQEQPPVALKRNIHFSRSNDGLNLIDKERGDLGGGGGDTIGTLV